MPAPAGGVTFVEADNEAVLVEESTALHLLNATAAVLWSCFDDRSTLAEVCADVSDALGVPFERVLHDAVSIVQELADLGLVVDARTSPGTPSSLAESHRLTVVIDQAADP